MARQFKIGDIVNVGSTNGSKGRVVDIIKPLGTYEMYKVMTFLDGKVIEAAKHELVKGLPDCGFEHLSTAACSNSISTIEESLLGLEGLFDDDFWEDNQDGIIPITNNNTFLLNTTVTNLSTVTDPVNSPKLSASVPKLKECPPTSYVPSKPDGKKSKRKSAPVKLASSTASKRFVPMSENDINDFVSDAENPKTKAKTHVRLLTGFLEQKGITTSLLDIPADELDKYLTAFFITVRQKNGSEYEPVTLRSMMSSFERYLRQNRQTKTRTGEDVRVKRKGGKPAMFAEPRKLPEQCSVSLDKHYADKRPVSALHPDSPFYLACKTIKSRPLLPNERWFLNAPIGVNKISNLLKNMASYADLPSLENTRLTNTSLRKHVRQTLLNNDIPDSVAVHVTGHKNPATLNNYRQLNNEQKYRMSHMLANSKKSTENIAKTKETASTPQIQSEVQSSQVTKSNINETLHTLFSGSTITGGTFNIAINFPK